MIQDMALTSLGKHVEVLEQDLALDRNVEDTPPSRAIICFLEKHPHQIGAVRHCKREGHAIGVALQEPLGKKHVVVPQVIVRAWALEDVRRYCRPAIGDVGAVRLPGVPGLVRQGNAANVDSIERLTIALLVGRTASLHRSHEGHHTVIFRVDDIRAHPGVHGGCPHTRDLGPVREAPAGALKACDLWHGWVDLEADELGERHRGAIVVVVERHQHRKRRTGKCRRCLSRCQRERFRGAYAVVVDATGNEPKPGVLLEAVPGAWHLDRYGRSLSVDVAVWVVVLVVHECNLPGDALGEVAVIPVKRRRIDGD